MSIQEKENEIIEEFQLFGDNWESKYEHIIDLGRTMPLINPEDKTDDRLIKGCQSRVWLKTEQEGDKLFFKADSEAIITKGLIALIIRVFNGEKMKDIINAKADFIGKIGLQEHLSPTRANGLISMINRMKSEALQRSK
ncbi:MAG: SufE family protein [Sphingobacteriaceae bacterium]|nr:SufE family protein [Sphingobacteriaceae bacterium]